MAVPRWVLTCFITSVWKFLSLLYLVVTGKCYMSCTDVLLFSYFFFSIWLCFADLDCYRYDREWMTSYKSIHGHVADWYPVLRVYCFILSQLFFAIQSCLNLCLHVFVFTMLKYTCEMCFFHLHYSFWIMQSGCIHRAFSTSLALPSNKTRPISIPFFYHCLLLVVIAHDIHNSLRCHRFRTVVEKIKVCCSNNTESTMVLCRH